jgi:hypothetical protein
MAGGFDGVANAVAAVGFHDDYVHGLLDVFVGAEDEAGFPRDVGDYLVVAFGGAQGFQFVKAEDFCLSVDWVRKTAQDSAGKTGHWSSRA